MFSDPKLSEKAEFEVYFYFRSTLVPQKWHIWPGRGLRSATLTEMGNISKGAPGILSKPISLWSALNLGLETSKNWNGIALRSDLY